MRSRREFLYAGAAGALASRAWAAEPEIVEATLTQLQAGLTSGQWTSVDLVRKYARIASIDRAGAKLNAVIELNPEAEAIDAALDRERKEKGPRRPAPRHTDPDQGQH